MENVQLKIYGNQMLFTQLLFLKDTSSYFAAHQAPLSLGFSSQEYWSGLPFPSPMHVCMLSCFSHVRLCVTLRAAAHQAPLSKGFSRQEYWSRVAIAFSELLLVLLILLIQELCKCLNSFCFGPTSDIQIACLVLISL